MTKEGRRVRGRAAGGATLAQCLELLRNAGRSGMDSLQMALAVGVCQHTVAHTLGQHQKRTGEVRMQRRCRAPAMWFIAGLQPEDTESVLQTGKALTVKTRQKLVLDHRQPTVVPEGVRVVRCPTRWA